jgi:predicted Zn-dependent protease
MFKFNFLRRRKWQPRILLKEALTDILTVYRNQMHQDLLMEMEKMLLKRAMENIANSLAQIKK